MLYQRSVAKLRSVVACAALIMIGLLTGAASAAERAAWSQAAFASAQSC